MVNLLLAGVEDDGTPSLYFMDYLASMVKVSWKIIIFVLKSRNLCFRAGIAWGIVIRDFL